MEEDKVEELLGRLESEIEKVDPEGLRNLGFWKMVRAAKKDPALAKGYGERIGRIDRLVFEKKTNIKLGYQVGTFIALSGALLGILFLYMAIIQEGSVSTLFYIASSLVLMTALHPLAHSFVGRLTGIGFHFYFLNGPMRIEPTLKIDYATYLKASPLKRVLFHLAGSLNSALVTFIVLAAALLDPGSEPLARVVLGFIFLFTASSEVLPFIVDRIFFMDFRKTDSYRAKREWQYKE